MSSLSEITILAFRDELRKEAGFSDAVARHAPMLKNIGAAGGVGALGGAALGGLSGTTHGYEEARDMGGGVAESALHGLAGGLGGALRGGALGALTGGVAGGVGSRLGGESSRLLARKDIIGGAARAGQRQVHSLTGVLSPDELEAVGGGAAGARQHLARLTAAGKPTERAAKGLDAAIKAQEMGLTSAPGYLSAMRKSPAKTLAAGAKEQYYNMPTAMGVLGLGIPAAGIAKTLATKEQPDGPGKGEQIGRSVGGLVGGVTSGLMPMTGGALVGEGMSRGGQLVGRVIDRIRGRMPMVNDLGNKAPLEPTESQNTPSERITSPSAAGGQKDIGL
jgi:hypothetical protein